MAPLSSSVKHFKRSNKSSEEKNNEDDFGDTTGKQIKIQINVFGLKGCVITHVSLR